MSKGYVTSTMHRTELMAVLADREKQIETLRKRVVELEMYIDSLPVSKLPKETI